MSLHNSFWKAEYQAGLPVFPAEPYPVFDEPSRYAIHGLALIPRCRKRSGNFAIDTFIVEISSRRISGIVRSKVMTIPMAVPTKDTLYNEEERS